MDRADVFSDDTYKKELHGGKEKQPDHKGCNAYSEAIPKDEFVNKYPNATIRLRKATANPVIVANLRGTFE